jgi:hypothetical protein
MFVWMIELVHALGQINWNGAILLWDTLVPLSGFVVVALYAFLGSRLDGSQAN